MADVASSISSSSAMNNTTPVVSEGHELGLISPRVMEAMDRIFPESTSELFNKSPIKNGKQTSHRRTSRSDRNYVGAEVNGCTKEDQNRVDSPVVPSETSPAVPSTERKLVSKLKISRANLEITSQCPSDPEDSKTLHSKRGGFENSISDYNSREEGDSDDMSRPFTNKKKHKKKNNGNHASHLLAKETSFDSEEEFQQQAKKRKTRNDMTLNEKSFAQKIAMKVIEDDGNALNKTNDTLGQASTTKMNESEETNLNTNIPNNSTVSFSTVSTLKTHLENKSTGPVQNEFVSFITKKYKEYKKPQEASNNSIGGDGDNISMTASTMPVEYVTVPSRAHSGIKLPIPKKKLYNVNTDQRNINRAFPGCFVVLNKQPECPKHCSKDTWSVIEKTMPLSVRMKFLKNMCNDNKINCHRQKKITSDGQEESRYKNIFEEDHLSEEDFQLTRGGKSLRRRNKTINYTEPSDVIDLAEESKNKHTDPNYFVDSDSDSDNMSNKKQEGTRVYQSYNNLVQKQQNIQERLGPDGKTQVYVYPQNNLGALSGSSPAPSTLFANSSLQMPPTLLSSLAAMPQGSLIGQPMAGPPTTSSSGIRPQYCMMKVDGKDMLVQLSSGPAGMQQVMAGGKRFVLSSPMQAGGAPPQVLSTGAGAVPVSTIHAGQRLVSGPSGSLLQSANRIPVVAGLAQGVGVGIRAPAGQGVRAPMAATPGRQSMVGRNAVAGPTDVIWELLDRSENKDRATCKHCKEVFMIHNSVTSILRHMQKKHPKEIKAARQKQEEQHKEAKAKQTSVEEDKSKKIAKDILVATPQVLSTGIPPVPPTGITGAPASTVPVLAGSAQGVSVGIRAPAVQGVQVPLVGRTNIVGSKAVAGSNDVIWELMNRTENKDRATCKHCKEVFMIHNSTTAILRHLQKNHPKEIKEARQKREEELQKEAQAQKNASAMATLGRVGAMSASGPRPPMSSQLMPPVHGGQQGPRNLRVYVPGCSSTNTPPHFTMLATMPTSSPLTRLSASSSLLPQRKRVADELTPEQKAVKRRKLEKKYPLPPGVVIKTEPLEAPVSNMAPKTPQPGMRSLLQTNIQQMFARPQGPGSMQTVRIISPQLASALANRHVRPGSNIMIRAGGTGAQTFLLPVNVSNASLTSSVTASTALSSSVSQANTLTTSTTSNGCNTTVSSSGPPHLLSTSSTSAADQTVIAQQQAIDNLKVLVKAQESRGLKGDRLDKLRILLAKKESDLEALKSSLVPVSTPLIPSLSPNPPLIDPVDGIVGTETDPFVID